MPTTSNFGWTTPADTDLVKDGAAAIRTLGNGVDASFVDLKGGTTGQILSKNSNTDLDFTWIANDQGDITAVTAGTGISGGGTSGAVTITNSMATEITASGDIIVGTGSGTFDNLPIGTTGQVLTADTTVSPYKVKWATASSGDTFTAGKNKIINGDFFINQRGFTSTTATFGYNFDRWTFARSGGSSTVSAETFTLGSAPVAGYEGKNFIRCVVSGQSAASDRFLMEQRIESVRKFANETITISFWAKAGSGTPAVSVTVNQSFGTGGSPSGDVQTAGGKVTISTSWARYSVTLNVPSIAGKTFGSDNNDTIGVRLWTSAGSDFNTPTTSLGIQNGTIDFWGVQAEAGSSVTTFQTATGTIGGELALCQRYFWKAGGGHNTVYGNGFAGSTTKIYALVTVPQAMRTKAPTLGYSNVRFTDFGSAVTPSALVIYTTTGGNGSVATNQLFQLEATVTGATANRPYTLQNADSTSGYIEFDAEV